MIDGHQETLDGGAESARRILQRRRTASGMGGDYGFAWNPHGDYAKELTFFVKYVGFTPLETITCATRTGAEIMGRSHEFGTVEPGKLADLLIVDGDVAGRYPLLEDRARLLRRHARRYRQSRPLCRARLIGCRSGTPSLTIRDVPFKQRLEDR